MDEQATQLDNILSQLKAKGASQEEMQTVAADFLKKPEEKQDVGFLHGVAQDIASPFLKIASTIEGGAVSAAAMLGSDAAAKKRQDLIENGQNYGWFGTQTPIGADAFKQYKAGEIGGGKALYQMGADLAGNMLEAYVMSGGFAPLEGIGKQGLWSTVKQAAPMARAFGASETLKSQGKGEGALTSAMNGASSYIGATAGFGLTKGGLNLLGNWGARALQAPAMRGASNAVKTFAEKVLSVLPAEITSATEKGINKTVNFMTSRAYSALNDEYKTVTRKAAMDFINTMTPELTDDAKKLAYNRLSSAVKSEVGKIFDEKDAAYETIKKVVIPETKSLFNKAGEFINDRTKSILGKAQEFAQEIYYSIAKNKGATTIEDILRLMQSSKMHLSEATPEEATAIRDLSQNLYSEARKVLTKTNPEVVDKWDIAYQTWKTATDYSQSQFLKNFSDYGSFDNFLSKAIGGELTPGEKGIFTKMFADNPELKKQAEPLIINALMSNVRNLPSNKEGAKFIEDFLNKFSYTDKEGLTRNIFTTDERAAFLEDLQKYMGENFEDLVNGIIGKSSKDFGGSTVSDSIAAEAEKAFETQNRLAVLDMARKGNFEGIADNLLKIAQRKDGSLAKVLSNYTDSEKKIIGMSFYDKLLKEELPLITWGENGTFKVSDEYVKAVETTLKKIQDLGGSDKNAVKDLFTDEQVTALEKAGDYIKGLEDLKKKPTSTTMKLILRPIIAAMYFSQKFLTAGTRNLAEAVALTGESIQNEAGTKFYAQIDKLINEGFLKANKRIVVADILKTIVDKYPVFKNVVGDIGSKTLTPSE